jgi:hypothetical protein
LREFLTRRIARGKAERRPFRQNCALRLFFLLRRLQTEILTE